LFASAGLEDTTAAVEGPQLPETSTAHESNDTDETDDGAAQATPTIPTAPSDATAPHVQSGAESWTGKNIS